MQSTEVFRCVSGTVVLRSLKDIVVSAGNCGRRLEDSPGMINVKRKVLENNYN